MPAGEIIRGIDGVVRLTSGGVSEEIPCLTSWTIEASADVNQESNTCMASNGDGGAAAGGAWANSFTDGRSFSLSTEHFWQRDQTAGTTAIADATNVGDTVTFTVFPEGPTGPVSYTGVAIIESVSVPSEAKGRITQSISYIGNGELEKNVDI